MFIRRKAYYLLIGFIYMSTLSVKSQDQSTADSLKLIYQDGRLEGLEKLELLKELSFNELNDLELSLKYANELVDLSKLLNNKKYLRSGYLRMGSVYSNSGDLERALNSYFKSIEIAIELQDTMRIGTSNLSIADVYAVMENYDNATIYYNKSIKILRQTQDSIALATALLNAGDAHLMNKKYDEALLNFEESGLIFKEVDYLIGTAYNLGNVGMVYAEQGKDGLAEKNINEAITILEELQDYYPISVYLTYMSDIYLKKSDWTSAEKYSQRSLLLAEKHGLKKEISQANFQLSELYEQNGNPKKSLQYYKNYIKYRDTVTNIESVQKIADLRTDHEVSQKQVEVDLLSEQKKTQRIVVIATGIALFLIGLLAIGLFRRNKFIQATKKIIEDEKERSDNLLLNILPEETAQELKLNGSVKARKFESVTVLFTDFKGFTNYAESLSPEKLVETVDFYFSKFDEILERHDLEKIKTVGDAYMCAGGLHYHKDDHALKMLQVAIEIREFVDTSMQNNPNNETRFDIRIGMNTGPVVAGVVGTKKFAYDIWGDTVNVASRMESNSEPGKINISQNTYQIVKDAFDCTYRGEIEVKNRGMMKMYFVNAQKINKISESVLQEMKANS